MITGSVLMTTTEARERITAIQQELASAERHYAAGERHFSNARELIRELYQFEGWKALKYGSWHECVQVEFERGKSQVYRQLAAAAVEQNVSPNGRLGTIPERVLRPLSKKQFTAETQRTLWEIAKSITGNEATITSGTMNAVVDTLSQALATGGTLEDADGEQSSIFERVRADVLARAVETRKRHQQYLEPKNTEKVFSAIAAKTSVDDQNNVVLTILDPVTPNQLKSLLNAKFGVKITAWVELELPVAWTMTGEEGE